MIDSLEARRLLAAITGRVFTDLNGDGLRQSIERPIAGATVYVDRDKDGTYDNGEPSATADQGGSYRISRSSLVTGRTYVVRLTPLKGYAAAARTTVRLTGNATLAPNIGAWKYAKVNLSAYLDANKNGQRDAGEASLQNVTYLDDANVNFKKDAGDATYGPGDVSLKLRPGQHYFTASTLIGYAKTGEIDLGGTFNSGQTRSIAFGYYAPAKFSGYVYEDRNGNNKRDAGEGAGDRHVLADADNDGHHDPGEYRGTTDASGYYELQLSPGSYTIRQLLPDGWTSDKTYQLAVTSGGGGTVGGYDFITGLSSVPTTGTITGSTFTDLDGDGVRDAGEPIFVGNDPYEIVYLDLNKNGQENVDEPRATLNADGTFVFRHVRPGTYSVGMVGNDTTKITSNARSVTVVAGKAVSAGSFGAQQRWVINVASYNDADADGKWDQPMSGNDPSDRWGDWPIGDRIIYIDANNNGKRDDTEDNVRIDEYARGTTGFLLTAGTYTIREEVPPGYKLTGRHGIGLAGGAAFAADSKLHLPADVRPELNYPPTLCFLSILDPVAPDPNTAEIHGYAFEDTNEDGLWNGLERGLNGQTVYLDLDNSGALDSGEPRMTTYNGGRFDFTGLAAGSYWVRRIYTPGTSESTGEQASPSLVHVKRTQKLEDVLLGSTPA